jgi:hypothetical protein
MKELLQCNEVSGAYDFCFARVLVIQEGWLGGGLHIQRKERR